MKKLYYFGLAGLLIFEILNVYFIMPMPGSQQMNTVDFAYFLYRSRWVFRLIFGGMAVLGFLPVYAKKGKWKPVFALLLASTLVFLLNFKMSADAMFLMPETVIMKPNHDNSIPANRLVIGIEHNGEAKAYPIAFLAYHHQVVDTVGGMVVMVTYCSVCRTGRVFQPTVNGKSETFRLVGMDHFNAMFEDATTRSWWRQSNGEAITGKLKGEKLPEVPSVQMTVGKWFDLYPNATVMQEDPAFVDAYDQEAKFEQGKSSGSLTRTDSLSWKDKSWVVGIEVNDKYKAYDWQQLKRERVINDRMGEKFVVIALAADGQSFVAFEKPNSNLMTLNEKDWLFADGVAYYFSGERVGMSAQKLKPIRSYQEFWHSWKTFHPFTEQYKQ